MVWFIWALAFAGTAVVGMVLSEVHESASLLARFVVRRAARRLTEPMRSVREEEWLAELDAMEGLHLLSLLWALHTLPAAWRSPSRRLRGQQRRVRVIRVDNYDGLRMLSTRNYDRVLDAAMGRAPLGDDRAFVEADGSDTFQIYVHGSAGPALPLEQRWVDPVLFADPMRWFRTDTLDDADEE